jgi:hypothetical protein
MLSLCENRVEGFGKFGQVEFSVSTLADTLWRPHFLSLLQHHYILLQRCCPRSHFYLGISHCPCRPICYPAADIYIYMDGKGEATMPYY